MTDHVKDQLCARIEELEKEKLELNEQVDSLQVERDALRTALQSLYDEQNGAPLERDRAGWEAAMRAAERVCSESMQRHQPEGGEE